MNDDGTVLITGGTGGLGRETARQIAGLGRTIIITGRDPRAAERCAQELSAVAGASVRGMALDLGSLRDVRRFADEIVTSDLPPLRAVVCNAGVQSVTGTRWTVDGVEYTFGVNHLAHVLLVTTLLEHLREPARVVFVSSGTHDPARRTGMPAPRYTTARELARPSSAEGDAGREGRRRYTTSKLCNVLATYELARRLAAERRAVTVNAYDPGLVPGTGLARDYGKLQGFLWRRVLPALAVVPGIDVHTPRQAAAGLARLVTDPGLQDTTGRYFCGTVERRSSADSYDRGLQDDLWATTIDLLAATS